MTETEDPRRIFSSELHHWREKNTLAITNIEVTSSFILLFFCFVLLIRPLFINNQ